MPSADSGLTPTNAVVIDICEYIISPTDKRDDNLEWVTVKSSPVLTSAPSQIIVKADKWRAQTPEPSDIKLALVLLRNDAIVGSRHELFPISH